MKNMILCILAICTTVLILFYVLRAEEPHLCREVVADWLGAGALVLTGIATSNRILSVALPYRGHNNAATPERVTIELFPERDGKENINALKIIAPKGLQYAWTLNRKSAHGIVG